ncbi:MFS transporter [Streptomyces sp. NPDC056169]|uniref:MFS transporter n=1 Tax=Streptomyces sp. NPDC056169 TaxID=3345734 RepID=UPI0035DFE2D0
MTITPTAPVDPRSRLGGAYRATAVTFFLNGLLLSTWLIRIPSIKEATGLGTGAFGTVLITPVIVSLLSMQFAGRLLARTSSRTFVRVSVVATAVALVATSLAHTGLQLALALALFGIFDGLLFVASNVQGVAVERLTGRPCLNSFHAAWSIGNLSGALVGSAFAWFGAGTTTQFVLVALLATWASGALLRPLLPPAEAPAPGAEPGSGSQAGSGPQPASGPGSGGWRAGWNGRVLQLGLLGLCCLVAQGALEDWGAVYLREERGASTFLAMAGLVAFSGTLVAGRLIGDRLREKYDDGTLLRAFALLAAAGLGLSLATSSYGVSLAGYALFGAGLSVLDPIVSSAAGHAAADDREETIASAVAHVATLSHTGLLLGPPAIGWLAHGVGLTRALVLPALLVLVVAAAAPAVFRALRNSAPTQGHISAER